MRKLQGPGPGALPENQVHLLWGASGVREQEDQRSLSERMIIATSMAAHFIFWGCQGLARHSQKRTESKFLSFFLFILFFLKQGQNQELSIQKYAALASFLCWLLKCFLMSNFISCNLIPTEQIKEVWRRAVYYSNSHSKSAFKLILYITLKLIQLVDA